MEPPKKGAECHLGIYKTEGIILKSYNLKEADRILTIYTKDYGKISAVAKGVRRSRSKLRGATQQLTYVDLVLYQGKSIDTITQCETKEMFIALREDLHRWAYAVYTIELLDAMVPERQPQVRVYAEFLAALHLIAALEEPEIGALFFTVRLLPLLGYQPVLHKCISCHQEIGEGTRTSLSASMGGILCGDCSSPEPQGYPMEGGELAVWRRLAAMEARLLPRLKVSPTVRKRLFLCLRYYLQYQLERRLKSVEFLKHLSLLEEDKTNPTKEN
ncbi:MAG: DNA repair protein RecO [Clostridia bacterium]|jgi:DNA repair protein RecO (recombination protein O)|nr:DNA repair protein RecO [Clostridia bacterium]